MAVTATGRAGGMDAITALIELIKDPAAVERVKAELEGREEAARQAEEAAHAAERTAEALMTKHRSAVAKLAKDRDEMDRRYAVTESQQANKQQDLDNLMATVTARLEDVQEREARVHAQSEMAAQQKALQTHMRDDLEQRESKINAIAVGLDDREASISDREAAFAEKVKSMAAVL